MDGRNNGRLQMLRFWGAGSVTEQPVNFTYVEMVTKRPYGNFVTAPLNHGCVPQPPSIDVFRH